MKTLILSFLVLSFTAQAQTSENRTYNKVSSIEAVVTIKVTDYSTTAASLIDGLESDRFVSELIADTNSPLSKAIKAVEIENCGEEGCGSIEVSKPVQTNYGKGGWASAHQSSAYFIEFKTENPHSRLMFQVSEGVEAQTDVIGRFSGTYLKMYSLDQIKKLPFQKI